MSTQHRDVADVLVEWDIITPDQRADARDEQRGVDEPLHDVIVRLGYASLRDVTAALAAAHAVAFMDLSEVRVPPSVLELVPESVARECEVLPLGLARGVLTVAVANPADLEILQKLQFILNLGIARVVAPREQIIEAINRHYGDTETESVDSMLCEFTDTAIDFNDNTGTRVCDGEPLESESSDSEFELALEDSASGPGGSGADTVAAGIQAVDRDEAANENADSISRSSRGGGADPSPSERGPLGDRHATVRYYHRMNPERTFPLLVVLSRKAVLKVVKRGVAQASREFKVAEGTVVEVEPILPGCACYPPKEQARIGADEVTVVFWVVPHVLGKVMQARVVVRQDGATLAEIPLDARVARQGLTLLMGGLSLVLPFGLLLLKHFKLDFESQMADGFGLYAHLANLALQVLTPETLTGLLLGLTAALYFWLRPARRDVFWDVATTGLPEPGQSHAGAEAPSHPDAERSFQQGRRAFEAGDAVEGRRVLEDLLRSVPRHRGALLYLADRHYADREHAAALPLYERALSVGDAEPVHFSRAALAAHLTGDTRRALGLLREAEARLPEGSFTGPMWYNRGCFATRLGRFTEAIRCLRHALDHGFNDPGKFQKDPDLEPLRWNPEFKRLVAELAMPRSSGSGAAVTTP
jgi:hypothetical protein